VLPHDRVLENTVGNQPFTPVAAAQGGLDAIGGYAHQTSVTNGVVQHYVFLFTTFW
jgi:hypothetical protein